MLLTWLTLTIDKSSQLCRLRPSSTIQYHCHSRKYQMLHVPFDLYSLRCENEVVASLFQQFFHDHCQVNHHWRNFFTSPQPTSWLPAYIIKSRRSFLLFWTFGTSDDLSLLFISALDTLQFHCNWILVFYYLYFIWLFEGNKYRNMGEI